MKNQLIQLKKIILYPTLSVELCANFISDFEASFTDFREVPKNFTRSLRTSNWKNARTIRDTEFTPIILDMDKARAQLNVILKLYPELEERLQSGLHGGYGAESNKSTLAIGSLHSEWAKSLGTQGSNYQTSANTAKRYTTICQYFVSVIGSQTLISTITQHDITKYRNSRLEDYGKSRNTVDLELSAIRNLFNYAVEKHKLPENPAIGVSVKRTIAQRNLEKSSKKRRPPSQDEANRICTQFPGEHKRFEVSDFQDYAMFARYTGMRQGEIAQITYNSFKLFSQALHLDVIFKNPQSYSRQFNNEIPSDYVLCIYVGNTESQSTKTGLERIVPVAAKLLGTVKERLTKFKAGPIFPFAAKDSGASFGRLWLKRVKKIAPELTMHGFRHYVPSEMENSGVSSMASKAILGHFSGEVHDKYVHVTIGTLHEAVNKIY